MLAKSVNSIGDKNQVGANPNNNPLCGKKIRARRVDERTGREASIDVTVIDRCKSLDLMTMSGSFKKLMLILCQVPVAKLSTLMSALPCLKSWPIQTWAGSKWSGLGCRSLDDTCHICMIGG